jgi:hypothetical protein
MARTHRTAQGKQIDMENIRAKNELVIAVGNTKQNGRGDLLGAGGKIVKTRDQVMREYYTMNSPVAADPSRTVTADIVPQALIDTGAINPESGLDEMDNLDTLEDPIQNLNVTYVSTPTMAEPVVTPVVTPPIASTPVDTIAQQPKKHERLARGALAGAVAKSTTVTQKAVLPPNKAGGIKRF